MAISEEKHEQSELDVYARPFIPQILRSINQALPTIIPSTPPLHINFDRYVRRFAGSDYLGGISASAPQQSHPNELRNLASMKVLANQVGPKAGRQVSTLQPESYRSQLHTALEQEAVSQQQRCDDHALYRVPIMPNAGGDLRPNMYSLLVPGLREMSLRVEIGDAVQLRQLQFNHFGQLIPPSQPNGANGHPNSGQFFNGSHMIQYNSAIWNIDRRNENLLLRIDNLYHMSMLFNVCFTVQSGRLHALHRAVAAAANALPSQPAENGRSLDENWMRSMLFPESRDGYYQKTLNRAIVSVDLYDEMLNYEQVKAVNTVLNEQYGPVPFIISGPPGTGKTKTIVELALQKLQKSNSEHLLLCAPSDPAADTLVQRLSKKLRPTELLRVNSPARSFPEVPSSILAYCCVNDGVFSLPSFKQIMAKRIVVTTCRDAHMLVHARLSNTDLFKLEQGLYNTIHPNASIENIPLHWTGLFIDEAAQATEPEALIPLTLVAPPKDHVGEQTWPIVVMVGDQHQLGPRTASQGDMIQTSLFERLLNRPFYHDHPLARSKQSGGVMRPLTQDMLPIIRPAFANLIRNYRSHPAILATPSSLFYNDTLEPEAAETESLLPWPKWPRRGWPVLFAANTMPDESEQDGGGWYNINEAQTALQYARSFLQLHALLPNEICIMSPFQAQVKVLRKLARDSGMHGVNIGPLEAFQGLESRLVILCTTRTRNRFIDQDLARGLGVIHEPKRFNVALTRAKEGLIVIGNPDVLRQDQNWKAFLEFCARNGLVDGPKLQIEDSANGANAIVSRLERQLLRREKNDDAAGGANDLANGVRKLGFLEDADESMWKSGVETEVSLDRHTDLETADRPLENDEAHDAS